MVSENIVQVGRILKNHGVKGEVTLSVDNDALFEAECIIVELDGLYVPFYIESRRGKSDSVDIIKIDGVDSEADAAPLLGAPVFLKRDEISDAGDEWGSLEGYKLYDGDNLVGEITAIDDQTENQLFIVSGVAGDVLIPVVDEWVESVDDEAKVIKMRLPDGLVDIN